MGEPHRRPGEEHRPGSETPSEYKESEGGRLGERCGSEPRGSSRNGNEHPQVARLEDGPSCGVGSSSREYAEEGEGTLRGPSVARG